LVCVNLLETVVLVCEETFFAFAHIIQGKTTLKTGFGYLKVNSNHWLQFM